ncbi:hypothetical protein ACFORG_11440 [Lutimaribacter marinistellae]|uniref:Beta/Gamma crystallin n=1 Tax=Lutimaribacter marinistellae TaxID=1820329 RepID=A0ABV7TFI6_9RHOB
MNRLLTAAAGITFAVASTGPVLAERMPTKPHSKPYNITISCYRGPTQGVIWDRPNAVFVEDLVAIGYSYPQATAIGERVCRDEWGVGQHDYMRNSLLEIIARTPPGR